MSSGTETVRPMAASFRIPSGSETRVTYVVRLFADGEASCECPGYAYRRRCRHIDRAQQLYHAPHDAFAEDVCDIARGVPETLAAKAAAFDSVVTAAQAVRDGIYDRAEMILALNERNPAA